MPLKQRQISWLKKSREKNLNFFILLFIYNHKIYSKDFLYFNFLIF